MPTFYDMWHVILSVLFLVMVTSAAPIDEEVQLREYQLDLIINLEPTEIYSKRISGGHKTMPNRQ